MKSLILVFSVFITQYCFSQQLFDYYNGYVKGYAKACGCSNKPPNSSKLYYHSGTYSEGYDAGFTDGRIFLNQNSSFNQEIELVQPNYELIYRALSAKQQLLNSRRQVLDQEYTVITQIIQNAVNNRTDKTLSQEERKIFLEFYDTLIKYGNYDLTVTTTYNQVIDWIHKWREYFKTW